VDRSKCTQQSDLDSLSCHNDSMAGVHVGCESETDLVVGERKGDLQSNEALACRSTSQSSLRCVRALRHRNDSFLLDTPWWWGRCNSKSWSRFLRGVGGVVDEDEVLLYLSQELISLSIEEQSPSYHVDPIHEPELAVGRRRRPLPRPQ